MTSAGVVAGHFLKPTGSGPLGFSGTGPRGMGGGGEAAWGARRGGRVGFGLPCTHCRDHVVDGGVAERRVVTEHRGARATLADSMSQKAVTRRPEKLRLADIEVGAPDPAWAMAADALAGVGLFAALGVAGQLAFVENRARVTLPRAQKGHHGIDVSRRERAAAGDAPGRHGRPRRPAAIAWRKNSSLTDARNSGCVTAGARSALYPSPLDP